MLSKIYIIDFEDSFTFNIASMLFECCQEIENINVVTHKEFFENDFNKIIHNQDSKIAIVLGPGPGHPKDYQKYFKQITQLRIQGHIYLMGICLGHQILGLIDGLVIKKALKLIHGQNVPISFKGKSYQVQRYNSLAVFDHNHQEINIREFSQGISYQFHPESIGTESGQDFFKELIDFIS